MEGTLTPAPLELGEATGELGLPLWANMIVVVGLVSLSALFSGLTLGIMSLDKQGLEILMKGGDDKERRYAGILLIAACPRPPGTSSC